MYVLGYVYCSLKSILSTQLLNMVLFIGDPYTASDSQMVERVKRRIFAYCIPHPKLV